MADMTVRASLLGRATSSTYLVNASVMQKINFLEDSDVLSGPKRSQCIRWFGAEHCGSGGSGDISGGGDREGF